jgi:uncharacterized membrane protein
MKRATKLFNEEQAGRINEAIAQAESRTSAEIVPVVITASGRYDRPEDMVGLWLALVLGAAGYLLIPDSLEADRRARLYCRGIRYWSSDRKSRSLAATVVYSAPPNDR